MRTGRNARGIAVTSVALIALAACGGGDDDGGDDNGSGGGGGDTASSGGVNIYGSDGNMGSDLGEQFTTPGDLAGMRGPVLAPGLGAQGARPSDLRSIFGAALPAVLGAYSREILTSGPEIDALRTAADRAVAGLRHNL